ncbi:RagB/SusD family nutrient uptake outer membrane protein [Puteibacter caeruleilacunae]|nr:RagB/SusD family nutrient uptake outer membrane protein [Puteibacter caeruleilacunae]
MKARITKYIYLMIMSTILFSCEKDLDLYPRDKFSEAVFFQNAEQFKQFATQFYDGLPSASGSIGSDAGSDLMAGWSLSSVSNGSYSPSPNSGHWSGAYSTIRNTTYLVQKVEEVDVELKNQVTVYIGEVRFFRAMTYFGLLKSFGGVPIIDKVLDLNDEEMLYGPRATREQVVDYILADLNAAITALPNEKDIASNDKGRVSKEAALSFKARVALFEGTWRKFRNKDGAALLDQAIDASNQVITGGQYELFDRRDVLGNESYKYFFILDKNKTNIAGLTKADQNEYIFVNKYDIDLRAAGFPSAHGFPSVTKKFADLFLCTDGLPIEKSPLFQGRQTVLSEYENRDIRMINILEKPYERYWANYPPEYNRNWDNQDAGGVEYQINFGNETRTGYYAHKFRPEIAPPFAPDYPVIRLAEVLLINAEAKFEKNNSITDGDLNITINKLRERAGLAALTNAFVSSNGLDMRNEIRRERTIELFLEGFRFDDLRRWKTAEIEMPKPLRGVLWKDTQYDTDPTWGEVDFPQDGDGYIIVEPASERKFEEKHYLFPLPTRQILLNPQLKQNPGWE